MPATSELVARSGDLKAALVEYGQGRRFARHAEKALGQYLPDGVATDNAELANAIDRFILEYRLPDGKTIVETFVEEHLDLTDEERTLLLGWRDAVEGIFEVERREGQALILTNLVDDLTYRTRSNLGAAGPPKVRNGSFLVTRLCRSAMNGCSAASRAPIPIPAQRDVPRGRPADPDAPGGRLS